MLDACSEFGGATRDRNDAKLSYVTLGASNTLILPKAYSGEPFTLGKRRGLVLSYANMGSA